jgi:glucose-1-phosphate cytidylyltransferase
MKVVLFCGGRGLRLREHSEAIPKPMVQIGYRPILWHVMRYYAHYGHRDFILCLGYRADAIKDYFLHYDEAVSNDFVLSDGGRRVELLGSDIADWRITFADTGLDTTIGERLRRVRHLLDGEEVFLANYGDTLTDAPLDELVATFQADTATTASFLAVRPSVYPIRIVDADENGRVRRLSHPAEVDIRINGGYFMLRPELFDVMQPGDELVEAPFARLIERGRLRAVRYDGFWGPLDTLTDLANLQAHVATGRAPWAHWEDREPAAEHPVDAILRVVDTSQSR